MCEEQTENQYDPFADDYDWILGDPISGSGFIKAYENLLASLPSGASILDCACGTGVHALALARRGYTVQGSDASGGMIAKARQRAAEEQLDVPFSVCTWEELPQQFSEYFDLVLCHGNGIGHCRDAAEMVHSLKGMGAMLKDNRQLVIQTRNFEKLVSDRHRFIPYGIRTRDGIRCMPLGVWTFPDEWSGPILVEVVFLFEENGKVDCRAYQITYYAFRYNEWLNRIKAAGLEVVESDFGPNKDGYRVIARRIK